MKLFWKIAMPLACTAVISGAAFFWHEHKKEKAAEQRLAQAARDWRVRAEQGDAKAQFNLALMYYDGQGVSQDYGEAIRWLRKAAEQGDAKAEYGLAYMYHEGQGVPQDYAEAVRWSRQAADQGLAKAQCFLGLSYSQGQGVPQDYAETVRWYRKAAEQGLADAQYALGNSYRKGQGVPRDYAEAVRWYRKAAGQGDANAQYALRFMQQGTPPERWTHIVALLVLLSALLILVVPRRRWGRATWLPWALSSALCTALLSYELLLSALSLELLARGPLGALWRGFGRVLLLALLGGASAIFTLTAVRLAVREWKRRESGTDGDLSDLPS